MSGNLPWVCVHVTRGAHVFYSREQGKCDRGLWREKVLIQGPSADPLTVAFTLTLQSELVRGAAIFAGLQLVVLLFLYLTTLRLEKERYVADARMGEFAAQLAHDIRSPLAALKALSSRKVLGDPESQELLLNVTDRIHSIAEGLLSQRRAQVQGKHFPPVEVAALLEMLVEEKRTEFSVRGDISIRLDSQTREAVAQVPQMDFLRAMSNLMNNAVESLQSGGLVTVSIAREGRWIRVAVQDTGRGISRALLEKIRQGQYLSDGKRDGNGLGLKYVSEQIQRWNGTLDILSEPGHGTRVTLSVPVCEASAVPAV
jgi:signal transduction histidine kinase